MLLTRKTEIKLNKDYANIISHMCYAAYKLWNVCNYERLHHKELSLPVDFPDLYYQKKAHKNDHWYKQLPSQTAQEVCKLLDKSWKSYFVLLKTKGVANPRNPRFKHSNMPVTYMQNGIKHDPGSSRIRLALPKKLMEHMSERFGISADFLFLENKVFRDTDIIKQIKIYPPEEGRCRLLIIYEVPDKEKLPDNGRYLSIDLGSHNMLTCYDSGTGNTFIMGRKYLSLARYFHKKIGRVQSQWAKTQYRKGIRYPKPSKHIFKVYQKKNNTLQDYLHKCTRYIIRYCLNNSINTLIIGDITNIRKDYDKGHQANQNFHSLPYKKIYIMLGYKAALAGMNFVVQDEKYTSQTSPLKPEVSKVYAEPDNRVKRGLYADNDMSWNADCVGAYNILRRYLKAEKLDNVYLDPLNIKVPQIAKVAV